MIAMPPISSVADLFTRVGATSGRGAFCLGVPGTPLVVTLSSAVVTLVRIQA